MGVIKTPTLKIRKVGRSSLAWGCYMYQVRCIAADRADDYLRIQRWAYDTFGPSVEYEFLNYGSKIYDSHFNKSWCCQSNFKERKYCIYLNEEELTVFLLRWQ